MTIYKTARFQVRPESVEKCKQAISEFIAYVKANEPGTLRYVSRQERDDATRFLHHFMFDSPESDEIHRVSQAVQDFTAILYPEVVGGQVEFTDYVLLAATED